MLSAISLFAGIGGFDLGMERTGGFKTIAVAETDPYASRVLAARFPGVPNLGDVTKADYPHADYIFAGFPCQDLSYAGNGAGLAGARSGLWREVVRAIRVVRPRGTVLENVAALLSRGLGTVLGDLAEVGHDAEWHCIPASVVGAPHRRDRIWIVTDARGEQHEGGRAPISGQIAAELSRANPDAATMFGPEIERSEPDGDHARSGALADAEGERRDGRGEGAEPTGRSQSANSGWWRTEPAVGRVAYGVSNRVDRLRCLGNAVVPQVVEVIGRAILAAHRDSGSRAERRDSEAGSIRRTAERRPEEAASPNNCTPIHDIPIDEEGQHDHA